MPKYLPFRCVFPFFFPSLGPRDPDLHSDPHLGGLQMQIHSGSGSETLVTGDGFVFNFDYEKFN
jgi:hypothetical protein